MVKGTRAAGKLKDGEDSSSKDQHDSGAQGYTREESSGNQISNSGSKTRKSERLEKLTPTKVGKKPETAQNGVQSPLRRSERGKRFQPSSSSSLRRAEKSSSSTDLENRSNKREKNVEDLNTRAKGVEQSGRNGSIGDCEKTKRMDARTYRAMLKAVHEAKVKASVASKVRRPLEYSPVNSESTYDGRDESQDEDKGQGDSNEKGSCHGSLTDDDMKGSKCDFRNPTSERLRGGNAYECSDSSQKDCCIKSMDAELKGSNPTGGKSASEVRNVEDSARSSYSAKKDNCIGNTESDDGGGLEVSDDENLSLPCSSGDEATRNPDNAESMQVDPLMTEKHLLGDVNMSTEPDHIKDLASESDHGGIISNGRRNYCGDAADKNVSSSTAEVAALSLCRSNVDCSSQACSAGFKRQRVDDNYAVQPQSCCDQEAGQVLHRGSGSMDRGDSEACSTLLLTGNCGQIPQQQYSPSSTCLNCMLTGDLFCCCGKGCKRSYHPLCLDPPLKDLYPGIWHCPMCVKKKKDFGVHAVSEGIESIWGVREEKVLNTAGVERQKQYFVKYKGLAHAHNRWINESQLLHEAPQFVVEFDQKKEVTEWKPEWAVPHRILLKRVLNTPVRYDENVSEDVLYVSNYQNEWLVKWCGLDYDNATWELEDASFFKTPEGQRAITEYEMRHNKVREMSKDPSEEFPKIPASGLPGADSNHLTFVSKLREYWHGSHSCFIINEQDQVAKIIYFILSLLQDVSRPFLIITPFLLSSWEAEFLRLAPSINVVVYTGNTNTRKGIRKLEFREGGCQMFQVLLSAPEAISEDLEMLNCIGWEAVIIAECQHPEIYTHSSTIKKLDSDWRLLLTSRNLKDAVPDYMNILSLLNSVGNPSVGDDRNANTNQSISALKEILAQHTLGGCKPQPSRFAEYWVPVHLSNLQLEQYSSILLSNSTSLRSCVKKIDQVGALREILVATLKCCNHPYVLEPLLQPALAKDRPLDDLYDIGGKASGKLQLLDAILSESKGRGLRFLILYQSVGAGGRDNIGNILEDYLQYRFGTDSYERIDAFGYRSAIKQAACDNFNKERARFIFLLESRACLPSVKLSDVDAVIIFNSDWNPLNDLRALQKITLDSKSQQISVFRLYSFCTVEENILILAKDAGNVHSINATTSHMLLMVGASYLFSKLDEFHRDSDRDVTTSIVSKDSCLKDVLQEFFSLADNHGKIVPLKFISKAQLFGERYQKNITLLGELKQKPSVDESPLVFWTKLLNEKQPRWKYLSTSSHRNKKRVQYFESRPRHQDGQNEGSPRKRKKVALCNFDSSPSKDGEDAGRGYPARKEKGNSATTTNKLPESAWEPVVGIGSQGILQVQRAESERRGKLLLEQRQLLLLLRPQILELCHVLRLREDVRKLAERFLEYVISNHRVSREPETILQAFQISVCWTAASLLSQKIDHKESVVLARERLKLTCMEDEAELVYSKMQSLKRVFLLQSEELRSTYSKDPKPSGHTAKTLDSNAKQAAVSNLEQVGSKVDEGSPDPEGSNKRIRTPKVGAGSPDPEGYNKRIRTPKVGTVSPDPEGSDKRIRTPRQIVDVSQSQILKKVKKVEKKCRVNMEMLKEKQIIELEQLHQLWAEEKKILEKMHRVESGLIHSIHTNAATRTDKLKHLADDYAKRRQELENDMTTRLKDLQARQQVEKNDEQQKAASLIKEVKSWVQAQLLNKSPSLASNELGEKLHAMEPTKTPEGSKDAESVSGDPVDQQLPNKHASHEPEHHVEPPNGASESANCMVDLVASTTRGDDGTTGDDLDARHISHEPSSSNPSAAEPLVNGLDIPASQCIPAMPMDVGMPDSSLKDVPAQQQDTAPEAARGGVNPDGQLISNFQTQHDASQADDGTSKEPISVETIGHDRDSNLACAEPTTVQPSMDGTLMMQPQERNAQSCQLLEVVRDQAESISEASLAHYMNVSRHEPGGSSSTIVAESTCVTPFPLDHQIVPSTNIHENQSRVFDTSQQVIFPSVAQNEYSAGRLNVVPGSAAHHGADPGPPGISLPIARSAQSEFSGLQLQVASPVVMDPLQVEYDRISREKDLAIDIHQKMMSQLDKDCNKEIEEAVAEIRRKYDNILQGAEASFSLKKKELDMNQKKVLMHKALAEAFRSKTFDYRSLLGMQQGARYSYARQLLQQQQAAITRPASGSSPASSGSSSSAYGQIAGPAPHLPPAPAQHLPPALAPALAQAPPHAAAQSPAPAPSGRVADRSPTILPNNPVRPPQARPPVINSFSPNAGSHQQVISERRAPPPHLQFRPPMPQSPRGLSIQVPGVTSSPQPIVSSPSAAAQLPSRSTAPHLQSTRPLSRTSPQIPSSSPHVPSPPVSAQFPSMTPLTPVSAQFSVRPLQPPPPPPPLQDPAFESGIQSQANQADAVRRWLDSNFKTP